MLTSTTKQLYLVFWLLTLCTEALLQFKAMWKKDMTDKGTGVCAMSALNELNKLKTDWKIIHTHGM